MTVAEPPLASIAGGAVSVTVHFGAPGPATDSTDVEPQAETTMAVVRAQDMGWKILRTQNPGIGIMERLN